MKNRELKNIIRKALQEQGGGPSSGPFYRVDAGGCIECPAGAGPPQCEFMDKNCTVHYSSNYSGGVGHPGEVVVYPYKVQEGHLQQNKNV